MSVGLPNLLYFCDFPPSNLRGGTILLSRLLADYSPERITVLVGSYYDKVSPAEGRLKCLHKTFPTSNETGRWGWGRLKMLGHRLLLPLLVAYSWHVARQRKSQIIIAVAHGYFFLAAALLSYLTAKPLVLFLHDDWVKHHERGKAALVKRYYQGLFGWAARRAAHIYVVSEAMQEMMRQSFGVASEVQLPATEEKTLSPPPIAQPQTTAAAFTIAYAGTGTPAVDDSLDLLAQVVASDKLTFAEAAQCELHLYFPITAEQARARGWDSPRIKLHGWKSQPELEAALQQADVLFLPFSFKEEQRYLTTTSFPTKASDYFALGKPILVLAPAYSSIARYAQRLGCALAVEQPDANALATALIKLQSDRNYQRSLAEKACAVFQQNHSISRQRKDFGELVTRLAAHG